MGKAIFLFMLSVSLVRPSIAQDLSADDYYEIGFEKFNVEDAEAALQALEKSLKLDSTLEKSWYLQAYIFHEMERADDAINSYDRLLQINPDHIDGLYNRGLLRMTLNDFDGALEDYDHSIVLNTQDPDLYMKRGYCHQLKENLAGAIDDYSSAIALDSTLLEAYSSRGVGKITVLLLDEDKKLNFKQTKSACEDLFTAQPLDDPMVKELLSKYCPKKRKN